MKKIFTVSVLYSLLSVLFMMPKVAQAGEESTYDFSWLDKDKEIFVLQNRKYRKSGKVFMQVGGGKNITDPFVNTYFAQGRAGYFFREEWGAELLYSYNTGAENDTAKLVRMGAGGGGEVPFRRIVENYMGALVLWSPFYAKVNTFNKIVYVDWIIGLGYGKLAERNNRDEFNSQPNAPDTLETHNAYIWETALQFYLSEHFYIRTDLVGLHYKAMQAAVPKEKMYSNYDLGLSLGFNF